MAMGPSRKVLSAVKQYHKQRVASAPVAGSLMRLSHPTRCSLGVMFQTAKMNRVSGHRAFQLRLVTQSSTTLRTVTRSWRSMERKYAVP